MNERRIVALSKSVSWLLRHAAQERGLAIDAAGWANIEDVLAELKMSRADLEQVVAQNNKSRFQIEREKIRASQGHSKQNVEVSAEALEASWRRFEGTGSIWHGTRIEAVAGIAEKGILPIARTHVHLAATTDSQVGKRSSVDVLLEVSMEAMRAQAVQVFESPNGVLLARIVPRRAIVGLRPLTRAARRAEGEMRAQLGL